MGTDGSRVHRYEAQGKYQPGLYRVFKAARKHIILYKTKEKLSKFPKIKGIFIHKEKMLEYLTFGISFPGTYAKIIRKLDEASTINPNYLKDLGDLSFDLYSNDSLLIFEAGRHTAAIMPMRM